MLLFPVLCFAQYSERQLFEAYQQQDMSLWKNYIDTESFHLSPFTFHLSIEYGYCGYIVAEAKKSDNETQMAEAKRYVARFREHVEAAKGQLPKGHYEMYLSAVYVFELRLHESIHPVKSMSLAKEATQLAPTDPIVLSYYGTCMFYAPKPFGSKAEALEWFQKAEPLFQDPQWQYRWEREANQMYIEQCTEKLKKQ